MKRRRKSTTRTLTIWETCRVCAAQMYGGPRCLTHNPYPSDSRVLSAPTPHFSTPPLTWSRAAEDTVSGGTDGNIAGVQ